MIAANKGGYKNNVTTYGRGSGYGKEHISKICRHCGKTWHTIDTCYRKHDFPSHSKFKNKNHDKIHANEVFQNTNSNNDEQNH